MADERADAGRLRASTADRERVAVVLSTAMAEGRITVAELEERLGIVYGATTLAELVPVTRDLPVPPGLLLAPISSATAGASRVGGVATSAHAVAIMSGTERKGPWVVPARFYAVAIMGGIELNLTQARLAAPLVTITVFALMGGVEITVPTDIAVRVDGIGIMGAFEHRGIDEGSPTDASPVVRINGVALMGGVDIRRPKINRVRLNKA